MFGQTSQLFCGLQDLKSIGPDCEQRESLGTLGYRCSQMVQKTRGLETFFRGEQLLGLING
jgi:hypothetical protein